MEKNEPAHTPTVVKDIAKANNTLRETFTRLKTQIVGQLDTSLTDLAGKFDQAEGVLVELNQTVTSQRKELNEENARIHEQRKRDEEEYTYEFTKRKQRQEAELKEQRMVADAEMAQERAELKKREDEFANLHEQVESFSTRLAQEIEKAKKDTENGLKIEFEHEKALSTQKNESQQVLLQQKIDSLLDLVKTQQQEISRLNKALSDANVQVISIAEKAVSQKPTGSTSVNTHNGND